MVGRLARGRDVSMPPALVELARENLAAYAGTYAATTGAQVEVTVGWSGLEVSGAGPEAQEAIELLFGDAPPEGRPVRSVAPASRTEFIDHDLVSGRTWRMRFELDARGAPRAALFETRDGEVRLPRAGR
jgi:hypothetical protein